MTDADADMTGPATTCSIAGCDEPSVVTPRSPDTAELTDAAPGELVPLCAAHAESANAPEVPPPA